MRRYVVDSFQEDEIAYKSSQSQPESSQCSNFDIYSQVMSQQQGFNSQSSEAPHIAQKYYTKFSSKPSLFKGKEVIAPEKHGLTRRRSFQDIHEFQKHRARDKEDRDLLCTLVSLLKDGTDEIQRTAEKVQSDLGLQVADVTAKVEDAIKKMHNSLHEFKSDLSHSVTDKLENRQSTEELQTKLKEKEAVLQTLREELIRTEAMKHDEFKRVIEEISSVQQKAILLELKQLKETCDFHFSDQKESFSTLCKDLVTHLEDTIKIHIQKVVEECTELMRKNVNEQHGNSHSSSEYQGNACPVPAGLPVNNVQTSFTSNPTIANHSLITQCDSAQNTASLHSSRPVMNPKRHDQALMSSGVCVLSGEDVGSTQRFDVNAFLVGKNKFLSADKMCTYQQSENNLSPPVHPQSIANASTTASSHFSRWTSKGPSPVAAVAPFVHDEVAKELRYMSGKRHGIGLKNARYSYQPTRRQSARLQQKDLKRKALSTMYAQQARVQEAGSGKVKVTAKPRVNSAIQHQRAQLGKTGWEMDNLYHCEKGSDVSSSRLTNQRNSMSSVHSNTKFDTNALYADLCKRQNKKHHTSERRSRVVGNKDCMSGSRNESNYKSDSSSPDTALHSVALEDQASQDLFIDAIDDHVYTSDEDHEMVTSYVWTKPPDISKQMDTLAKQKIRTIKKRRTLWSSGSSQNRDLLSFLASSTKQTDMF